MNLFNLRQLTYSQFAVNVPTATARRMQADRLASDLLRHEDQVKQNLPELRAPTYREFRRLVHGIHGKGSTAAIQARQLNVYESFKDLHRLRVHRNVLANVKSKISTQLKLNNITNQRDLNNMYNALALKQHILHSNLSLLCRMNEIYRVRSYLDSFTREFRSPKQNNVMLKEKAMGLIKANSRLGCRLLSVKSRVNSFNPWRPAANISDPHRFDDIVRKYSSYMPRPMQLGRTPEHSPKELLRPIIYFEMAVRPNHPLGRICIQLYTEVSPEVVLEFVRLATENDVQAHKFTRIFPDLWLEGQLMPQSKDALKNHHDHPSPLDARRTKGLLSYSWDHRQRFPNGLLVYTISFKTLAAMPLKRVCFGVVLKGLRLLEICRDFGTRRGKPTKGIEIVKCGLL